MFFSGFLLSSLCLMSFTSHDHGSYPKPIDNPKQQKGNKKEQKNYCHGNSFSMENHKRNKISFAWRSFRNETSQFPF